LATSADANVRFLKVEGQVRRFLKIGDVDAGPRRPFRSKA
jgi:hypothetical protein